MHYHKLLFKRQQERFKTTEAFQKEVIALKQVIDILQQQLVFSFRRMAELQNSLTAKDTFLQDLRSANEILEIKHASNKKV